MALAKIPLSGSTHGRGIKVAGTVIGSATTLHTAQATTTDGLGDEVVLYARNSDSVSRTLSIAFGGTTAPDDVMTFTIAAGDTVQVCSGLLIRNALVVGGFADATNVVVVFGYVIRST
jgi:hypothetical protein